MADGRMTSYTELADLLTSLPLLCRERRRRGLSLRGAAKEMGVSFSTVTRFEAGDGVRLEMAAAVLRWLDGPAPVVAPNAEEPAEDGA